MATKKFSELTLLTAANAVATDFMVINDVGEAAADQNKRIVISELATLILNQFESTPIDKDALMYNGSTWDSRPIVEADISDLQTYAGLGANSFTAQQSITDATSPQVDLIYDGSNNTTFETDSAGKLIITPSGGVTTISGRVDQTDVGAFSAFFGFEAGLNDDLVSNACVAFGYQTLKTNVSGNDNVCMGAVAGEKVTGSRNAFFGSATGRNPAGSSNNTAMGYIALFAAAGSANTAMGSQALSGCTGANNIAFGFNAGANLVNGSNNMYLGYDIDAASTTESNILNIGNYIFGDGIDGTGTTVSAGRIGLGVRPTGNMTGLTIEDGVLGLKEITTPTADSGYGKIYTKTDNKLYVQTGDGVEHEIAFV